jgi:hypothetical protein
MTNPREQTSLAGEGGRKPVRAAGRPGTALIEGTFAPQHLQQILYSTAINLSKPPLSGRCG